jgi:RNA polymerase sigma-70 factor (ECF subfamily)
MSPKTDFKQVYEEFQPKILRYLSRLMGDDEAEDITQQVFEKVNVALDRFEGRSKLSTWVYRIATNTAKDRFRSPSFKRALEYTPLETIKAFESAKVWAIEAENPTDQEFIRKEMSQCVREYIDKLSPDHRTVIILKELDDILQVSLDTVKTRLHRARAALKKELDHACNFYHNEQGTLACDRKPTGTKSKKSD